jgi:enamine deaminase RidA (YjgF/YER057c/UK114 family)
VQLTPVEPVTVPAATGGYVNALQVEVAARLPFIRGQIPQTREGFAPEGIEDQCRLVWENLTVVLTTAGMDETHLVKVTTFLGDRKFAAANTAVRNEVLGEQIEAIAAA